MKKIFTIISFLIITTRIFAASGEVRGVVYDKSNNETLPGASVIVAGTNVGTITNMDGEFSFMVAEGTKEIEVRFVGYKMHKQSIQVKANEALKLNIKLEIESVGIKEISVTAMILGQAKAVNQQLSSDAIVNVVSEDKIKELPDANAAEAIGRLPGIALTRSGGEASKVVVRGMGPSFTNVTINGVRVAASSDNDRSTDLSMISSEMLAGVEVYKSPTPDMDGESIGGTVNLTARKARNKPLANVKISGIYNNLRSDFGNFKGSGILQRRFFDKKLGVITQVNVEKVNRSVDYVSTNWDGGDVIDGVSTPNVNTTSMTSTNENRSRFGLSLNLDYKLENGAIYYSGFYNKTDRDILTAYRSVSRSEVLGIFEMTSQDQEKDVMSNSLSGNHKFGGTKFDWVVSNSISRSFKPNDLNIEFEQADAYSSIGLEDRPNTAEGMLDILDDENVFESGLQNGVFSPDSTIESNTTIKLDWEIPFNFGARFSGSIKTGGKYRIIDRTRREHQWKSDYYNLEEDARSELESSLGRDLDRNAKGEVALSNFVDENYEQQEFLDGDYDLYYPLDQEKVEDIYNKDKDNWNYYGGQSKENEYDVYERLTAGYLMAKVKLFNSITVIPGIRLEYSNNDYTAYATTTGGSQADVASSAKKQTSTMNYLVVLPHFHLKYKPVRWFDTRLVINKTVGRPSYNRVLPYEKLNSNGNPYPSIQAGNGDLNPTMSTNYDLSASFYKGTLGLISGGVFYKDIKDYIYKREKMVLSTDEIAGSWGYSDYTGWSLTTYDNVDAKSYGFELELQTVLKFLPEPLNGIVLSANYSHQLTEVVYQAVKDTVIYTFANGSPFPEISNEYIEYFRTAPMINQSPNTFNLSVGWDFKGFSMRVSGIYQDEKLSTLDPAAAENDKYYVESWQWDASMSYTFLKDYKVFAQFTNITNRHDYQYQYSEDNYTKDQQYGFSMIYGIQAKF